MTCTQRNSLVFMTSTLIIFLQIQTYSIVNSLHSHHQHNNHNNHYHPHHHHPQQQQQQQQQHLNYTDYNQFTSSSSSSNNNNNNNNHNPFGFVQQKQPSQQQQQQQQSHLRHHHHQHQLHTPSRNREQVQHNYQHKIPQTATNNNATPFRSFGDQIASPLSSSSTLLNSYESNNNKHYNNKIRIKNQKQHSNVGGINNSDNGVVNYNNKNYNNNNNNKSNNKNITLKTHHQSNNKFTDINIGVGNQRYHNDRRSLSSWNRNSLLHHDDPSIQFRVDEDEEGYHIRKSFGSKVHAIGSDRLHQHLNINSTKYIKNLQTTTTTQKNWELPRKNIVLQLPKSILKDDQLDLEDYYDEEDDDDESDDGEDSGANASDNDDDDAEDDENLSDTIIRKNQFNSFQSKFTPAPIPATTTTTTTAKSIKDVHNDFSYDYLYDEPTNDTDDKSGSLTEEKWRNYGTVEAVEKSRRRHLSEAQIIAAHITRINIEAMCKYPRPKIIQINETSKRYVPHCTVLHRCADDTGCCHSESQTCVAKKTVTVDLHFYAIPLKTKDPIVEVLSFVNHTECHCVDRFPSNNNRRGLGGGGGVGGGSSSTSSIPDNNNLQFDNKNNFKNDTCNCIRHFDIFEDDFIDDDDNIDYQQTDLSSSSSSSASTATTRTTTTTSTTTATKNHSNCRCDCTSDNLTCQRLKRGQEGIPVDDRRCISEGRCILPTCEYGIYNKYLGRCPRAITKRTINDKT